MKKAVFAGIVACVGILGLAACSDDSGSGLDASAPAPAVDAGTARAPMPGETLSSESFVARDQAPTGQGARQEVITGSLSMVVDDPIAASKETVARVEGAGGRIDSRSDSPATDDAPASSSLQVRLPADDLDASLDRIEELGDVTSVSTNRSDVTLQSQDLDARIAALQGTVTRFQQLITTAADTADLIAIESALSDRQGQLDSLRSQKSYLADQIDLASISVSFSETDSTDDPGPGGFWGGVVSGWNSLIDMLGGFVVFVGAALPWVGAVLVVAAVVYVVVRVVRRRRATAQTPPSNPS